MNIAFPSVSINAWILRIVSRTIIYKEVRLSQLYLECASETRESVWISSNL